MTKEDAVSYFESNFTVSKEMIVAVALWADKPDADLCRPVAEGLQMMANAGNKKAAALYAAITAYGNHAGCFSEECALQLLFSCDAVAEYLQVIDEEIREYVDEDFYNIIYSFPVVSLFKEVLSESHNHIQVPSGICHSDP